jgi:hypothetical protein
MLLGLSVIHRASLSPGLTTVKSLSQIGAPKYTIEQDITELSILWFNTGPAVSGAMFNDHQPEAAIYFPTDEGKIVFLSVREKE